MKLLFVLDSGIGNVTQCIPLYLALKEHYDIDVAYMKQSPNESAEFASFFPADVDECTAEEVDSIMDKYPCVVRPPFMTKFDGEEHSYDREHCDGFYELDSEFERNMKILDGLGVERSLERDFFLAPSHHQADVCFCNGAQKGWEKKKYPFMGEVAKELTERGVSCVSIGNPDEYVPFTQNATGTSLKRSVGTIANCQVFLGTDTGCYHIAALMQKSGIVVFTATDPLKNWDENFHSTIQKVHNLLPCQPCQTGYHYSPDWNKCKEWRCQDVNPAVIVKMVMSQLDNLNNLGD